MDELKRFFYNIDQTNSSKPPSYGFVIFKWIGIAGDRIVKKKSNLIYQTPDNCKQIYSWIELKVRGLTKGYKVLFSNAVMECTP
jgi:hypothetical protein